VYPKENVDWVAVSATPLEPDVLTAWVTRPNCGAVVTFCGTARSSSSTGHDITELQYETSDEMALARLRDVVATARERWPELGAVAIQHRVGRVLLEQPAVVVEAAQFCIDTVKKSVPMWKREVWLGGSAWSQEAHDIVEVRDA